MDFSLSGEQSDIQTSVRRYCREQYGFKEQQKTLASEAGWSRDHWSRFAQLGWLGVALPSDVGGLGSTIVESCLILEEFGRALVLEPYLACAVMAAQALDAAATPAQRAELLPPIIEGASVSAFAHGEPPTLAEPTRIRTRAERRDGRFILNGHKSLVLGGSICDQLIVSARTSGVPGDSSGLSLFVVPRNRAGVSVKPYRLMDGRVGADVAMHGVEVGERELLGAEGAGFHAIEHALHQGVAGLCAEGLGGMDVVITTTKDYLKTRRAYGGTLSTFQALQHKLADMLTEMELCRSMLYRLLASLTSNDKASRERTTSAAKALFGQSARFVGANGIQLHGAIGMSDEYFIGHHFKRLSTLGSLLGTSEYHLARYAQLTTQATGVAVE